MSDDPLQKAITRGKRAELLLQDELLAEAFKTLEEAYTRAWRETQYRDTDARERLWQAVNIVGKVRDHLGKVAADGTLASREVDGLSARPKRFGLI